MMKNLGALREKLFDSLKFKLEENNFITLE